MSMSNREITALERHARASQELATAISSGKGAKEYKKERLALEAAAGGAKRIADADRVLKDAHEEAAAILAKAGVDVASVVNAADQGIKSRRDGLEAQFDEFYKLELRLKNDRESLTRREELHAGSVSDLQKKGESQLVMAAEQSREAAALRQREEEVTERERKADEFSRWRENAPAE